MAAFQRLSSFVWAVGAGFSRPRGAKRHFSGESRLKIAKNICEALEAAHEKGVVHRDLKPGNVKITPEGNVKVLDFGLAKALDGAPANATISNSPTLTLAGTNAGVILGTAAYMSPEQARCRLADQRSDVFSFGCVLYEMLTGRQAFQGEEVSDVLASAEERTGIEPASCKAESENSRDPSPLSPEKSQASVARRALGGHDTAHDRRHINGGQKIVFSGTSEGRSRLWLRSLDSVSESPLPGTDSVLTGNCCLDRVIRNIRS